MERKDQVSARSLWAEWHRCEPSLRQSGEGRHEAAYVAVVGDVGGDPVHVGERHQAQAGQSLVHLCGAVQQLVGHREDEGTCASHAGQQACTQ